MGEDPFVAFILVGAFPHRHEVAGCAGGDRGQVLAIGGVRIHLALGTDRAPALQHLPDRVLAEAAEAVLDDSDRLWSLFDALCGEIVERAVDTAAGEDG